MKMILKTGEVIKTKQGVDSLLIYLEDADCKGTRMVKVSCLTCGLKLIKSLASIRAGVAYNCGENACRDALKSSKAKRYKLGDMVTSHYRYVGEDLEKSTLGHRRWVKVKCICDRSSIQSIRMSHTTKRSCQQCGSDKQSELIFARFPETSTKALFRRYEKRAKSRAISFDLDYETFLKVIKMPCFYCNLPPSRLSRESKRGILYTGIDRLDSTAGYIKGNMVPCCSTCNVMKKNIPLNEFISQVNKITRHLQL